MSTPVRSPPPTSSRITQTLTGLRQEKLGRSLFNLLIAIVVAIASLSIFLLVLGADPLTAMKGMVDGSLGNSIAIGQTLLVTAPLIFCGIAAAIPFSAQIFNVGGDGQLTIGAVGSTAVSFWAPHVDPALLVVLCLGGGIVAGALWGFLAGALKAYASANEVIVTLMLNFVAALVASYAISSSWRDPVSPQTRALPTGVDLPGILGDSGANIGVLLAVAAAAVATILLFRTRMGFGIRVTGFSTTAARLGGFEIRRITIGVLAIAGGFAGLGGGVEVLGNHHALVGGISANYGFIGVAVALVARLTPPV